MAYSTISTFSLIQSFYADAQIVNNASEVTLTSVELYFKTKPSLANNNSGSSDPGVTISICEMDNDTPNLNKVYSTSSVRKSYQEIIAFIDGSSPMKFVFTSPLKIKTNGFYGIVVQFEDVGYQLWTNKQGDRLIGTNSASPGVNTIKDGKLYTPTNSGVFKALSDTDLKFGISVAQYVSNNVSVSYVNKSFEFLKFTFGTGNLLAGEYVYKLGSNATGNVSFASGNNNIVGVGTTFTGIVSGTKIVLYGNNSHKEVLTVSGVSNSTYMTVEEPIPFTNTNSKYSITAVGKVYYKDPLTKTLILKDSTANSTVKFANSDIVIGVDSNANGTIVNLEDYSIDHMKLRGETSIPSSGRLDVLFKGTIWNGSAYGVANSPSENMVIGDDKPYFLNKSDCRLLSRSIEVAETLHTVANLFISNKSLLINVGVSSAQSNTNLFVAPSIKTGTLDLFVSKFNISNVYTTTDANTVTIDSEVAGSGIALSRHISSKLTFANNKYAEDLKVYMNAYRPANTSIRVYARVHNSADPESFDDRSWTPLEYVENGSRYSSSVNKNDFIEFTLGLPQYSESANVIPGTFTSVLANTTITASGVTPTTYLANNDMVKLYNPLIPEDYIIAVAESVNSTAVVLGSAVSNNNLVGSGFKVDRLKYYNTAFNNITTDNVARYYNSSLVEFDTFDSMQIKIVLLSDTTYVVPKVDNIRPIGVSV